MTYLDVLKTLYTKRPHGKVKISLGLKRMERLLDLLGNPQENFRSIHVTGTNGKGSTARMLYNYLVEKGFKASAFFSPHLYTFRERIEANGRMITEEEVVEIFEDVYPAVEKMDAMGDEWRPSFFEVLTAMVFTYFKKEKVDWAVVEVGLGGRLDATNVINPEISVITTVDFDHMKILGNTLEKIAWEKSGIIKDGKPVVTGEIKKEPLDVIVKVSKERGSPLYILERDFYFCEVNLSINDNTFNYRGDNFIKNLNLHLNGRHQIVNASIAIKTLEVLNLLEEDILRRTLRKVVHPGRFEVLNHTGKIIVLDGAHNEAGATVLARTLEDYFPKKEIVGVIGILDDKNRESMVEKIHHFFGKVYVSKPKSHRAEKFYEVCDMFRKRRVPCELIENGWEAFKKALKDPADVIVVAGSLYLTGEIRMMLVEGRKLSEWDIS